MGRGTPRVEVPSELTPVIDMVVYCWLMAAPPSTDVPGAERFLLPVLDAPESLKPTKNEEISSCCLTLKPYDTNMGPESREGVGSRRETMSPQCGDTNMRI